MPDSVCSFHTAIKSNIVWVADARLPQATARPLHSHIKLCGCVDGGCEHSMQRTPHRSQHGTKTVRCWTRIDPRTSSPAVCVLVTRPDKTTPLQLSSRVITRTQVPARTRQPQVDLFLVRTAGEWNETKTKSQSKLVRDHILSASTNSFPFLVDMFLPGSAAVCDCFSTGDPFPIAGSGLMAMSGSGAVGRKEIPI